LVWLYISLYIKGLTMSADQYLWQRGRVWWFRLAIPRDLRRYFLSSTGRPLDKFAEPLSRNYDVAKPKAMRLATARNALFDQIRTGAITTTEQAQAALLRRPAVDVTGEPVAERDAAMARWNAEWREAERRLALERQAVWFETYGRFGWGEPHDRTEQPAPTASGETVSQAAEAWFAELTRDKTAAPRDATLGGHRLRVKAFVDRCGDVPLTDVTRAKASDFLAGLDISNRTRNAYATTLRSVFECARRRGRFTGEDPFDGMKAKVAGSSYQPFTVAELQTLFDKLPRDVKPKRHTPDTALPWVALIALYTGMRLEEIAQLTTADIREESANGASVWCIDVHNGGENKLKNETSARLIPVHSELVRLGLLDYVKALRAGPLFPGLTRRQSKGGKVGARVGELFRKKLVALGIKREGLCFHSFRHTVAGRLDAADVRQSDAARILGHAVAGMSYGDYSKAGPGLIHVKAVVEKITYEDLRP
jgi:integrase